MGNGCLQISYKNYGLQELKRHESAQRMSIKTNKHSCQTYQTIRSTKTTRSLKRTALPQWEHVEEKTREDRTTLCCNYMKKKDQIDLQREEEERKRQGK